MNISDIGDIAINPRLSHEEKEKRILAIVQSDITGVNLIAQERQKQIDKHGFTGKHHVDHPEWYDNDQLQIAATTLLMHELQEVVYVDENLPDGWDLEWFEDLNRRQHKERLIIAGALIAAELDRLKAMEEC